MKSDLSPSAVSARLAKLRALYVPITEAEARRLMTGGQRVVPFEEAVARRLEELRALCELTEHLHTRAT